MSTDLIDPQKIPQFTGDLEQLGTDHMLLTGEALAFRQSGSDVHTRFQGLSACYTAPEAEQLFATTAPVAAKADEFADDLEKVAAALSAYETEIQPLVARLKSLKRRAETFRQQIAGDDDWREDDDNVQLNNDLVYDVNATTEAFWLAEITCHDTITALVGGSKLILEDGADKRLVERGTRTYGFTAELLNQSEELPWGNIVEKERHGLDWLGHQVWEFGKGFVVDGVWGTIQGLGTLVGFDGWDAAGEAWKGLGKLATGVLITAVPVVGAAYWAMPEDKLPSYLRDSRNAVKETGKALVAWDQWGENPARAGGAVTFNVLTTVFTGGAGAAAKSGAVARTVGALGRTARLVDPMTYLGKAATFGTVKVADLFAGLRGVHAGAYDDVLAGAGRVQPDGSVVRVADDTPVIRDNVVEWPDGTRLNLDDGSVVRADGTAAPAKVELSAADRELLESLARRDPAPVGAHTGDANVAGAAGDSAPGKANNPTTTSGGRAAGSMAHDAMNGSSPSHGTPSGSAHGGYPSHGDGPPSRPGPAYADAPHHGGSDHYGLGDESRLSARPDADSDPLPPNSHDDLGVTPHGDPAAEALRADLDSAPAPGPGHKVLAQLPETRVTRANGLITHVDGRSVNDYLDQLSRERGAAYRQAKEAEVFPRKQTGACVGSVIDLRTGEIIEGINGKPNDVILPDKLHPTLTARYEAIRSSPPHKDHPLGHAEVKAANELLWERTKKGLPDGEDALIEMRASVEFPYLSDKATGAPGRAAPYCANCNHMLQGVPSSHGRFTGFPPSDENWIP
ncbi:YwqJ-related putative deaminase [Streptomyces cathayae]|uniref:YwqJ-related putative deaminase n=1 Tax=Streptomyces cathayae TaxID=3031124 RepID=A0ABY8K4T4_9ACTN|nr:YwqJ-related putative deaminase [Streptomyces sp. HUAS 5]WGD42867.1 YwqJ-related putative deaminase [Streptomyces sp. HUAS 5]